jgi:tetratricopeptide (TPR) repeat protein
VAVAPDLAWLWERRGDADQALRWLDEHLARNPDDAYALDRRTKLKAQAMGKDELRDEVETLVDLGEGIPDAMFATYLDALLRSGEGEKAREVTRERLPALPASVAHEAGWKAYHLQAYDLATELFLVALPANPGYAKLLNALVKSATAAGRREEAAAALRELAQRLAPEHRNLWGYARRLG